MHAYVNLFAKHVFCEKIRMEKGKKSAKKSDRTALDYKKCDIQAYAYRYTFFCAAILKKSEV